MREEEELERLNNHKAKKCEKGEMKMDQIKETKDILGKYLKIIFNHISLFLGVRIIPKRRLFY